jgi:hypothetical protein
MFQPGRARIANRLTAEIGTFDLPQILMHPDFVVTLRSEAVELRERLIPDRATDFPDLRGLIDLALRPDVESDNGQLLSVLATRALSGPIGGLQRKIASTNYVPRAVWDLLRDGPVICPTVVGHIEPLLLAYLRCAPDPPPFFSDGQQDEFFLQLLDFAHFAGIQSLQIGRAHV